MRDCGLVSRDGDSGYEAESNYRMQLTREARAYFGRWSGCYESTPAGRVSRKLTVAVGSSRAYYVLGLMSWIPPSVGMT